MTSESDPDPGAGAAGTVNISRILLFSVAFISLSVIHLARVSSWLVSDRYFVDQDVWVIIGLCVMFVALSWRIPGLELPRRMPWEPVIWIIAVVMVLALWAGTYLIMFDYPLTRDEHMVVFDQEIFSTFRLSAPLPAHWAGYAVALVPAFLLDVPGHAVLASNYFPANSMTRLLFSWEVDPALMNPVLAAMGFVLLHRIARRLFPDSPEAVWVALIAYVLSVQVWVNAMTTYAMTGHLALNLAWLALFLRGGKAGHAGALAVGFWAIGWHQVVFHPIFAAPFILTLLWQKRWSLFLTYSVFYVAFLLFWLSYPHFVIGTAGIAAASGSTSGGLGYLISRALPRILDRDPFTFGLMQYNLLRYIAWQPLFVLPLSLIALVPVWRGEGIARPLAIGIGLNILVIALIIPYQGHGWGYRYLHGLIGNGALLAGYGYRHWAQSAKQQASGLTVTLGIATLAAIPFLLVMTHLFVKPFAELTDLIHSQKTDFVVVDTHHPALAIDQVRNRPDLTNRPLVFSSRDLSPGQLDELCRRGTIALIRRKDFHSVGFYVLYPDSNAAFEAFVAPLADRPCLRPVSA